MRSLAPTTREAERADTPGLIVFSLFAGAVVEAPSTAAAAVALFKNDRRLGGDGFCGMTYFLSCCLVAAAVRPAPHHNLLAKRRPRGG